MSSDVAVDAFFDLRFTIADVDGLVARPDGLFVHGKLFAFLMDDDLVVELPLGRMAELELRGVAMPFLSERHPTRDWVSIADPQLWPELAREAHEYVGEPLVGGES